MPLRSMLSAACLQLYVQELNSHSETFQKREKELQGGLDSHEHDEQDRQNELMQGFFNLHSLLQSKMEVALPRE